MTASKDSGYPIPVEQLDRAIVEVRGKRVILSHDLAAAYGVSAKRLNEQVKRNTERFPDDFMFQLTPDEKAEVVANCDHLALLKFSPSLPYASSQSSAESSPESSCESSFKSSFESSFQTSVQTLTQTLAFSGPADRPILQLCRLAVRPENRSTDRMADD